MDAGPMLNDIIRSKRSASRIRDTAVLPVLEKTLDEKKRHENGGAA